MKLLTYHNSLSPLMILLIGSTLARAHLGLTLCLSSAEKGWSAPINTTSGTTAWRVGTICSVMQRLSPRRLSLVGEAGYDPCPTYNTHPLYDTYITSIYLANVSQGNGTSQYIMCPQMAQRRYSTPDFFYHGGMKPENIKSTAVRRWLHSASVLHRAE